MTEQASLVLDKTLGEARYERLRLDMFPLNEALPSPAPTAAFIDDISMNGVLQPVLVEENSSALYVVWEGIRRIKAARACGHEDIPAMVYPEGAGHAGMTLVTNIHRSSNAAGELQAVLELLDKEDLSVDELATRLRIKISRIKRLLKLRDLVSGLHAKFLHGEMRQSAAFEAARLPEKVQKHLAAITGKVTLKAVKDCSKAEVQKKIAEAPDGMFDTPAAPKGEEPVWPLTVGDRKVTKADLLSHDYGLTAIDAEGSAVKVMVKISGVEAYKALS